MSTRIKDAGIAIRHSQGGILFYTAGSGNGLEGVVGDGTLVDGLKTRLQKKHISHPSSQAPALARARPPAQAQGLRRRMENLKKERPNIRKNI